MSKKLDFKKSLKALENQNNFLVHWFPFNGEIRNTNGEVIGSVSTRIADKLIDSDLLTRIGRGNGLLNHETYYKPKEV